MFRPEVGDLSRLALIDVQLLVLISKVVSAAFFLIALLHLDLH